MTASRSPLAVTLKSCAKTFADGVRALDPLDLSIAPGETLVFLGPSGCGKTTTLRLIAGLERPDPGGQVLFDGEDVTALPIERRQVGMVFQSYALFPHMSVAENVGYGPRIAGLPKAEVARRVEDMLAMMRIEALANRKIDQLSGGQRQRVALARALAVHPRALLLDEPLTALDAKLRDTLRLEIDTLLRKLEITAVYVTHDQAEAMALGDRIVVMEHGRVAQIGSPREIYHHPSSRFVADFIGTMNRVSGALDNGQFQCAAGRLRAPTLAAPTEEILFRPEDVTLIEEPSVPDGGLRGKVLGAFFLGEKTRVFVEVGEAAPVVIESTARRDFAVGETLTFTVDPRHLLVF